MKKINPFPVDDIAELRSLAHNKRLKSHPALLNLYTQVCTQYENYILHGGSPWHVSHLPISSQLKTSLIMHYENPPKGRLEFIKEYRRNMSPMVCPMCGGFGNGTLDHYLPKTSYPEFSFFSNNLVPACNCNSLRSNLVKGPARQSRAIHPYFDFFLDQRLYQSTFDGSFESPTISIAVIDDNHPNLDVLQFHLDNVIINEATQAWFDKQWGAVSQRPHHVLKLVLPEPPTVLTGAGLAVAIEKYRDQQDQEFETPNNWKSIFYTGLIKDQNRIDKLASVINSLR